MKKYFSLAALALVATAFTACSSDSEMNPEVGYGYIALDGVTTEAILVSRADPDPTQVSDLSTWDVTVTAKDATSGYTCKADKLNEHAFEANDEKNPYTVTASNYADLSTALSQNSNWGAPYYTGSTTVNVVKGKSTPVSIACGKAKNARLSVSFDKSFTDVAYETIEGVNQASYSLVATQGARSLTFNSGTSGNYAYYEGGSTVNYSLSYKFNGADREAITGSITLGANGTQKNINIMLNSNGKLTLTITTVGFTDGEGKDITIDGATGNQATN